MRKTGQWIQFVAPAALDFHRKPVTFLLGFWGFFRASGKQIPKSGIASEGGGTGRRPGLKIL
jgi:hypothetical protein